MQPREQTMPYLVVLITLLLAPLSEPFSLEHLRHLDWQKGMQPGQRCPAKCQREQCPGARLLESCHWGQVRDLCRCCWECGNGEGQLCDPEPRTGSMFFGQCADGLRCKAPRRDPTMKSDPKPVCVCTKQDILCGTDGKTYENICQLRALQRRLGEQKKKVMVAHHGPCRAKPVITYAPGDIIALEGSNILLSCEVSSYPVASIQWRKEGDSTFLVSGDSNTAIQASGSPRRFELTGWLQIHKVSPDDAGVYTCAARNTFGETSASARLQVIRRGNSPYSCTTPPPPTLSPHHHFPECRNRNELWELLPVEKGSQKGRELPERQNEADSTSINEDQSEDDEDYEGQPSGYTYL